MKSPGTNKIYDPSTDCSNCLQEAPIAALKSSKPSVDSNIEAVLGQDLRNMFSDILDEPVPQRFVDLLDNLVHEAEA